MQRAAQILRCAPCRLLNGSQPSTHLKSLSASSSGASGCGCLVAPPPVVLRDWWELSSAPTSTATSASCNGVCAVKSTKYAASTGRGKSSACHASRLLSCVQGVYFRSTAFARCPHLRCTRPCAAAPHAEPRRQGCRRLACSEQRMCKKGALVRPWQPPSVRLLDHPCACSMLAISVLRPLGYQPTSSCGTTPAPPQPPTC